MTTLTIISNETRSNLLIGALEGGSNYWYFLSQEACNIINSHFPRDGKHALSERMWKAIEAGAIIPVHDVEDENEELGKISLASIEMGESLMLRDYPDHFADIIRENDDAITADIWFQLAVMEDVTYG